MYGTCGIAQSVHGNKLELGPRFDGKFRGELPGADCGGPPVNGVVNDRRLVGIKLKAIGMLSGASDNPVFYFRGPAVNYIEDACFF